MLLLWHIINNNGHDLDNISWDEKCYWNFLIYDVTYKTPYSEKPLHIIFDEVHAYIKKDHRTKNLALFYSDEKYERTFNRTRYLNTVKGNISDAYSHKYTKIKIAWNGDLSIKINK